MFAASALTEFSSKSWNERPAWRRYAGNLLRYYARTARYRLRAGHENGVLAYVDPAAGEVFVTAALPQAPQAWADRLAARPGGARDQTVARLLERPTQLWLEGLLAHEAGHVRFSGEKPRALLGWLWNALEDERMEGLMSAAHLSLAGVFTAMGDVMIARKEADPSFRKKIEAQSEKSRALGACLYWRWLHDCPNPGRPTMAAHYEALCQWMGVAPGDFAPIEDLIEEAWRASSSNAVTEVARKILAHLEIPEDAGVPEGLPEIGDLAPGAGASSSNASAPGAPKDSSPEDSSESSRPPVETAGEMLEVPGAKREKAASEPEAPAVDPGGTGARAAEELLSGLCGPARRLGAALRPTSERSTRSPHRSRGRFEYHRWAAGRERVFARRRGTAGAAPPARLSCVVDLSGSMKERAGGAAGRSLLWHAQRTVCLAARAAEIAGVRLRVVPFRSLPEPTLDSRAITHEGVRAGMALLAAHGGNELALALKQLFAGNRGAPGGSGVHVVFVISDGRLRASDYRDAKLAFDEARRRERLALVPVLVGGGARAGASAREEYERVFGRCIVLRDAAELPALAERWVRHALR